MTALADRGRLITLEGGEGSGKSTLMPSLAARLEEAGHRVVQTREPGGTPEGERLREVALSGRHPVETVLDLIHAQRAHHAHLVIEPALAAGAWVVSDRYVDSTIAYQAPERPGWTREIVEMSLLAMGGCEPDLTLWLDLDPEEGLSRLEEKSVFDSKETAFHERVRRSYQLIAKATPERFVRIDAGAGPEAVLAAAWALVSERLLVHA